MIPYLSTVNARTRGQTNPSLRPLLVGMLGLVAIPVALSILGVQPMLALGLLLGLSIRFGVDLVHRGAHYIGSFQAGSFRRRTVQSTDGHCGSIGK